MTLDPVVSGTDQDMPSHKQSSLFQQRCLNAYQKMMLVEAAEPESMM
jgi:hypothetical protein